MEQIITPIEEHLQELFIAVIAYMVAKYNYPNDPARIDMTPQPEALGILYQLRNYQTTYWPGGLANQPSILLMELNKCIEAEKKAEFIIAQQQGKTQDAQLGLPNQPLA